MTKLDKALFAFASYNAGPGRVSAAAQGGRQARTRPQRLVPERGVCGGREDRPGNGDLRQQHLQVLHRLPPGPGEPGCHEGSRREDQGWRQVESCPRAAHTMSHGVTHEKAVVKARSTFLSMAVRRAANAVCIRTREEIVKIKQQTELLGGQPAPGSKPSVADLDYQVKYQRDFGWCWTGVSGWVRVAPQGCPGVKASGRAVCKAGGSFSCFSPRILPEPCHDPAVSRNIHCDQVPHACHLGWRRT